MPNHGIRFRHREYAMEFIRSCMIRSAQNEPLPSLRRMMVMSSLGRIVLQNAIKELIAAGALISVPRRGYFRVAQNMIHEPAEQIIDIIACAESGYMNIMTFTNRNISALFQHGTDSGYRVRLHRMGVNNLVSDYQKLVKHFKIHHAFLVMSPSHELTESILEMGVSCVVVYPRYYRVNTWAVCDSPRMIKIQMEHLLSQNHRRIAFMHELHNDYYSYSHAFRREEYYRIMAENGLRVYPHWVSSSYGTYNDLSARLDKMFKTNPAPSAIICGEFRLPELYNYFRTRTILIGRDVSVISEGECRDLRPRPVRVNNSPADAADMAWNLMIRAMRGEKYLVMTTDLSLQEGNSVFTIPALE